MSEILLQINTGANELLNSRDLVETLVAALIGGLIYGAGINMLLYASTFSKRMREKTAIRESRSRKTGNFS